MDQKRHETLDLRLDLTSTGFRATSKNETGTLVSAEADTEIGAIVALLEQLHPGYEVSVSPFALMAGTEGFSGSLNRDEP